MSEKDRNVDLSTIIMSLIACFFVWTIGKDVWTLELLSIVVPLIMIYNLIPYIVRLFVGIIGNEKVTEK